MRRALPVIIALVAGIVLGALLSPLRYTFLNDHYAIYRCDRISGRVDIAEGRGDSVYWKPIAPAIRDLSDRELIRATAGKP